MNAWLHRGLIGAGLALLGALLLNATEWVDETRARPLPDELVDDGTVMARSYLQGLGLRARRADDLQVLPPASATLVLTAEHWALLQGSRERLRAWVEVGGHLVLDADTLETVQGDGDHVNTPGDATDHGFPVLRVVRKRDEEAGTRQPCRVLHQREDLPPAFGDSADYVSCLPGGAQLSAITPKGQAAPVPLWAMSSQEEGLEVLRLPLGRGRVTAFAGRFGFDRQLMPVTHADGGPMPVRSLSNRGMAHGDHAALLAALVEARPGGEVWFVTRLERPHLLQWLWQHGAPGLLLAAAALALWLWQRAARFGPVQMAAPPARRSLSAQIRGHADFLFRHQPAALHAMALRALEDTAASRLAGWARVAPAERAAALARFTGLPEAPLAQALSPQGTQAQIHEALRLLETTRRALLSADLTPPRDPR